ncbi:MAG: nucleotidyltransferase family protein [Candidatus Woesearchaeota archaeon]
MKLSRNIILAKLNKNREFIRSYGVKKLVLFGSFSDGNPGNTSDIDFLVEFQKNRGFFKDYVGLKDFLEDLFKRDVDLVKPKLIRDELRQIILDGKKYEAEI